MSKNKKILKILAGLALSGAVVATGALAACGPKQEEGKEGVYYIAADGKYENDGKTIATAKNPDFLNSKQIQPGDTIYIVPGVYSWQADWHTHHSYNSEGIVMEASGTPDKPIRVINAALDPDSGYSGEGNKVVLDFSQMAFNSSNRGVSIYGNYIDWYGIDVCGAGDNGLYIGGSYNTVEYCEFYNNRDTGLQLGRSMSDYASIDQWPSYNLIKNCTSHNNYDDETYGENADGFAAKLTIGYGNVFDGCIAYRNSDDGWDLYAKSDSGNIGCVIIYNCVAFENGYLEYTQRECHDNLNYNSTFNEPNLDSYKTRDGDGNGFKLGGSVMEGDVKMYNCLSFQNRMHGVTDNSNPGYLKVEGVTSYDNSAAIDDDKNSATFGQVVAIKNHDTHGNIDVARQTYSYNTVKNVLSVKSSIAQSLDNDAYRGSVINSLLVSGDKTNVVKGSIDADTKVSSKPNNTSSVDSLDATAVFKTLPVVKSGEGYTYNISGLKDRSKEAGEQVHAKFRNADHSINMGDILAVKDDFNFSTYLGEGVTAGSTLNKTEWKDYTHFTDENIFDGVKNEVYARLLKAQETLTINTEESAVYQDFEVPSRMTEATVDWSTDSNLLSIGKTTEKSLSQSEYITIGVTRPTDKDTSATLKAKITYLNRSIEKTFELNIKKDEPSIGGLSVKISETNEVFTNGGMIIMDAYKQYKEPVLEVENGAYYNGTLLKDGQYEVSSRYEYATSSNDTFNDVAGFAVNRPGVYRITHTVSIPGSKQSESIMYRIFVAAANATVDFAKVTVQDAQQSSDAVTVFRDGYIISGELSNVTGTLYTVASADALSDLTTANIKEYEGVQHNDFRATSISFPYANENSAGYHVYYALANADGDITSQLYEKQITKVDIDTAAKFMKVAGGEAISGENVSQTIYALTDDIDFEGETYSIKGDSFKGLLNGQGHTVKNVTVSGAKNTALIKTVEGGTLMNIKFDNIKINAAGDEAGLVSTVKGGYFHNIAITKLLVNNTNGQRTGGLIAHVYEGATPTEVSQVSLINPLPKLDAAGEIDAAANGTDELYYIFGSGNRAGGIIGFVQTNNPMVNSCVISISDCYVSSYIKCGGYSVSSIVGEYNENGQMAVAALNGYEFSLSIESCVSAGVLVDTGTGRIGGMVGYHNGANDMSVKGGLCIQTMYYKGALMETAQKNQSPTIGNFSTSAKVTVSNCVGLMEEYNTDYGVTMVLPSDLERSITYGGMGFDDDTKWTFVKDGEAIKAPYLSLNFLGNWE